MDLARAYAAANAVLGIVNGSIEEPPARNYVTVGLPAFDCAEVVVGVDRMLGHLGDPSVEQNQALRCLAMRAVELSVWVIRCVPVLTNQGTPPTPEHLDTSAQVVLRDPIAVMNGVIAAHNAGQLGDTYGVVFMDWRGITPEGGLGGGVQRIRVDLTGPIA